MSEPARSKHSRLDLSLLLSVLVVLAFSLWATYYVHQLSSAFLTRQSRSIFDQTTITTENHIKSHLDTYLGALRATQGLILASEEVNRSEWQAFVETLNLPEYYPGISELGVIEKVPAENKDSFTEMVRTDTSVLPDGYPDFTIHPDTDAAESLVVTYLAPNREPNYELLGWDFAAQPEHALAAQRAEETGLPTATKPMFDPSRPSGMTFSIVLPVYGPTVIDPETTLDSTQEANNLVVAFFRTDTLFAELFKTTPLPQSVELEMYSGTVPKPETLIYKNYDERTYDWELVPEWLYARQTTIEVGGQIWTLRFSAPKTFGLSLFEQRLPLILLVSGLLFTLGLCIVMAGLDSSRFKAANLAQQMTKNLQQSETQYRAIFENLQDVYYRTDLEGRITVISPSITKYIGLEPREVIGRMATDFYTNPRERDALMKELLAKGSVTDYQINLQGQGAQVVIASLNAHLITDEQNQPIGVEGMLRDITERKEAEKRLQERSRELERANRMMVDRELRMIELKEEIQSLKAKLNLS